MKNGFTSRGEWKSQDIVVAYNENTKYPHMAMLECAGKILDVVSQLQVGAKIKCFFEPDAVNYKGGWFNKLRCWKIEKL